MKKIKFIDIFCGAGGLSCGLEQAGMRCILGIDHDKSAIETFALNHQHANTFCGNIEELTTKKLKELLNKQEVDLIVGGPPCQGFSTVGKGDPNDKRNKLFLEYLRLVKLLRPNFIIIENVTGLLAKKNEKTLQQIFQRFTRLGYTLDVQVMSAHQYGVPEKRRRTIILGSRINQQIIFPPATHDLSRGKKHIPAVTVADALSNLYTSDNKIYNHDLEKAKIKDRRDLAIIKHIPPGRGIRYAKDEKELLPPRLRLGIDWEQLPENRLRQTKYYRLNPQLPSPTIMTHRHSYYHPTENRYLTQREAAALQSFPNDFIFTGSVTQQWRQIGNAVPPLLGKALGTAIIKMQRAALCAKPKPKQKTKPNKISKVRSKAFHYKN